MKKVNIRYEVMCLSRECQGRSIAKYKTKEEIPIGKIIECPECGEEFEIEEKNIFSRIIYQV